MANPHKQKVYLHLNGVRLQLDTGKLTGNDIVAFARNTAIYMPKSSRVTVVYVSRIVDEFAGRGMIRPDVEV
jgi:hypothetical protein